MSTRTTNYNLIKPEYIDTPDITSMNPNWDIIDEKLKEAMESGNDRALPAVTSADNGKTLMVVNEEWQTVSLPIAEEAIF